jgi:2-haloalkanoic acid dehalogenase type II
MRRYDVVTFDCYGTLVDWERGIGDAFAAAGVKAPRAELVRLHAQHEAIVEAESYRSYREVLAEVARRVLAELGEAARDPYFLPDSLPSWRPFVDTVPALRRLAAAGVRLGILSNVDDELLAATRRHLDGVPFDFVVTAAQVRSYKPAPGHWQAARVLVGGDRWLHAAQSTFHDVQPARALAIDTAWVNRKAEAPLDAAGPTHEVPDLAGLAALVVPWAAGQVA